MLLHYLLSLQKNGVRIHEQYLDKVTLDLSKGRFFTWLSFS